MNRTHSDNDPVERLVNGEPAALARAISHVERRTAAGRQALAAIRSHLGSARVKGVTGVPGAGKSTLMSRFVGELRRTGVRVGVIAVDPSSPVSGGAVVG